MPFKLIIAGFLLIPALVSGQQSTISFSIVNEAGLPLQKAVITAKAANRIITAIETDSLGKGSLQISSQPSFTIEISHIGYLLFQKKYQDVPDSLSETIVMKTVAKSLDSVIVVTRRPLVVVQPDRYVLNVEGSTAMGSTSAEVIKKAPGITISNDQVFLEGKPVMLQIDGKNMPMTGKQLLDYLSSNSSAGINQIELITTPPANMDASFSGGVINLKLKKLKTAGYNGSFTVEVGTRSRYPFGGANANINYRKGKMNLYGSIGAFAEKRLNENDIERFMGSNGHASKITEDVYSIEESSAISYTAGADFYLSKKTILGLMITGRYNNDESDLRNHSVIMSNNSVDSMQRLNLRTSDRDLLNVINLNFKRILDSAGQEINIDLDYNFIDARTIGNQFYRYLTPSGGEYRSPYEVNQVTDNSPELYGLKIDYKKPFKKLTFESGFKFAESGIGYRLDERRELRQPFSKTEIRDTFNYDESIYAAYASIAGKIRNLQYRLGLRGELTALEGKSFIQDNAFDTSYVNLFPTIALTQKIDKKNTLSLSFRRSITRPRFNQLNPFRYYVSPFYFYTGNPYLRPFFPYSLRLGYSFNNKVQAAASYSFTNNKIIEISTPENNTNVIMSTRQNAGRIRNFYLNVSYYDNLAKWWFTNNSIGASSNNTSFNIGNDRVKLRNTAFNFSSTQRFTLPKGFTFELFGYYSSAAYFDASYLKPFGYIDFSASKTIFGGKGQLTFRANDILYTNITRSVTKYSDVYYTERNRWDSRRFYCFLYYSFGDKKIERNRQRNNNTANTDERNRAN